jgi:hypothetical protein
VAEHLWEEVVVVEDADKENSANLKVYQQHLFTIFKPFNQQ